MQPEISVVMSVRNTEDYIKKCIESILAQAFKDFELIIIDDASEDSTIRIVEGFNDDRIKVVKNMKHLGIAKSRNKGLRICSGRYVFFADGDSIVSEDWIEQGVKSLQDPEIVGVEGRVCYVSEDYSPTFSDHYLENKHGGQYMGGNVAYRKKDIQSVGGFDEKYTYFEDRDLALRMLKKGRITFNPKMLVYGRKQTTTPCRLLRSASNPKNRVYLFKRFGDRKLCMGRIFDPMNLMKLFMPPLILGSLILYDFKTSDDFRLLPFTYVYAVLERLQLWKTCATERVLLI